jgi:hypothetical protein
VDHVLQRDLADLGAAARRGAHQAFVREALDGLAQWSTRHSEPLGELYLVQVCARWQLPPDDFRPQLLVSSVALRHVSAPRKVLSD